ncbi:MAG: energy transducer TonB [Bacteroidales bacterium]|nr:energy transducer TonB [Bacteroidales bacterium]MCF8405280.1 energy transducer TonB [Bacteroidales bacterium]
MKTNLFIARLFGLQLLFLLFYGGSLFGQDITAPSCYGGNRLLRQFIMEEMVYPSRALESKTEGIVELSFIVKDDGSVANLKVLQKVSPEIDEEAKRIFRKILWYPATQLGKPVTFMHTFKIKFKIKKYLNHFESRDPAYYAFPFEPMDTGIIVYDRKETDQMPRPILSSLDRNISNFISRNLVYPDAAFKGNVSGTVNLNFVVEPSGRISNIEIKKGVGGGCTEEAIRVIKMIKWFPGIKDNLAVRTSLPIEITFDISKKTVGGSIPSPGQVQ